MRNICVCILFILVPKCVPSFLKNEKKANKVTKVLWFHNMSAFEKHLSLSVIDSVCIFSFGGGRVPSLSILNITVTLMHLLHRAVTCSSVFS